MIIFTPVIDAHDSSQQYCMLVPFIPSYYCLLTKPLPHLHTFQSIEKQHVISPQQRHWVPDPNSLEGNSLIAPLVSFSQSTIINDPLNSF